ncbi:MAG TPA: ABC transporter ATP-binding protein [Bacteroidales bacterium]|nr:ABC transporter ATP-binding protein [Bacteroidales bacterium]HRZ49353.1 ABC transporter ATP-binding protein [Bacteroidales bacterium]
MPLRSVRRLLGSFSSPAWRYYGSFYRPDRRKILWTTLATAGQTLLIVPALFLVKYAFDRAIPEGDTALLVYIGLTILILRILQSLVAWWLRNIQIRVISRGVYTLRESLVKSLFRMSYTEYTDADLRGLHVRVVQDTERIAHLGTAILSRLMPSLLIGTALLIICLMINWYLVLIIILFIPLLYIANRYTGRKIRERVFTFQKAFEEFSKGIAFVLRYLPLTILQSAKRQETDRQQKILQDLQSKTNRMAGIYSLNLQIQESLTGITAIVIIVAGGISVALNRMTLGDFFSFYMASLYLNKYVNTITGSLPDLISGNVSLNTLYAIASSQPEEGAPGEFRPEFTGKVEMRGVAFSYGQKEVLKQIDLVIGPGERIVIAGENGAGKTTLLNLLAGLLTPSRGEIFISGYPQGLLDQEWFRQQIGIVTQHPQLLPGTILENIVYGSDEVDTAQAERVIALASAAPFLSALPDGWSTRLGDEGLRVSGGEGQRIAIARALYRNPKLLILDEPTNHLDPFAISQILDNLRGLNPGPSILLISHDQSVAGFADHLYRLSNGVLTHISPE